MKHLLTDILPYIGTALAAIVSKVAWDRTARRKKAQDLYAQMADQMRKQQIEIAELRAEVGVYAEKLNTMLFENGKLQRRVMELEADNKKLSKQLNKYIDDHE